jgi:OCT family organic cation transporter-like MFS transporter 4/5
MLMSVVIVVIFGSVSSFVPYYEMFLVCVFFCGFAAIGFGTVAYCWMMELLSGREKTIFGCAPHFNYAVGGLIVAGVAYISPDWHNMQLIFSLPLILLLGIYWILPESPR